MPLSASTASSFSTTMPDVYKRQVQAGADGGVPIIAVDAGALEPCSAGWLAYFFELSSCLCAGMMGRDLYEDEPPAACTENMTRLLGKQGS